MVKQCGGLIALSPVGQLHLLCVGTGWVKYQRAGQYMLSVLSWFCHRADCSWPNGTPLAGRVRNSGLGVTYTWRSGRTTAPVRSFAHSSLILIEALLLPSQALEVSSHQERSLIGTITSFYVCWWPYWDCITSGSCARLRLSWLITVS